MRNDTIAATERMEGLEDGVEKVVDVLLEDTSLVVVDSGDVGTDDISIRAAELSKPNSQHL